MFLHLSVSHSVHRERGVYPSMHWGRHPLQWWIQDFPEEGAPTPQGAPTYNFAKFSPKLHIIERIWIRGVCVPHTPLDLPLPWTDTSWADTPRADTPWADTLPTQCMLRYTLPHPVHAGTHPPSQQPLLWTVHILLECILV